MLKKFLLIIFIITAFNNFVYSQSLDEIKKYETCADELLATNFKTKSDDYFFAHFETRIDDYLSLSIKNKIENNQVYEWFYEDCEKQAQTKPISFNLKNTLYKDDIDEITSEVFERCADERYVLEFGDTYSQFLDLNVKEKMKQQIEYEWYVEACEDEYREYPIKFKLKYY
jgi:hypothetical protein